MNQGNDIRAFFARIDHLAGHDLDELIGPLTWIYGGKGANAARQQFADWLSREADLRSLKTATRETPTHFIWPLYQSPAGFSVVINEYKDPLHMGDGYAKTIHDHRYSFASVVLRGGYTHCRSTLTFANHGELAGVVDAQPDSVSEGGITLVGHQSFHRLTAIMDHTVTLLVKSPPVKAYSTSADLSTHRLARHMPADTRVPRLVAALL